ncbi:hypothetical protein ARTSIC4J27_4420 [Pseudarthrobacter siccitolerans]|uniref:Uncharacterized protein n=1 Tax=Pseudarthrobacter siccitolerans TaxID=861266 RepID=A0A024H8B1_9MICC|nr:hypothetical protein ARTSIC4J27_4420 [Pseudarthrobacter siccitolerans]
MWLLSGFSRTAAALPEGNTWAAPAAAPRSIRDKVVTSKELHEPDTSVR